MPHRRCARFSRSAASPFPHQELTSNSKRKSIDVHHGKSHRHHRRQQRHRRSHRACWRRKAHRSSWAHAAPTGSTPLQQTSTPPAASARSRALDVTSREDMEAFVAFVEKEFGRVDVVVNNAGVMPLSPMEAPKVDEWERMLDVNGPRRSLRHRRRSCLASSGRASDTSSMCRPSVVIMSYRQRRSMCATKFAVRAISDGLRQENSDIPVTVISPGVTTSELGTDITDASARAMMDDYRKIAIGPDAIARAIAFAVEPAGRCRCRRDRRAPDSEPQLNAGTPPFRS